MCLEHWSSHQRHLKCAPVSGTKSWETMTTFLTISSLSRSEILPVTTSLNAANRVQQIKHSNIR
jgi:hypothetical protein